MREHNAANCVRYAIRRMPQRTLHGDLAGRAKSPDTYFGAILSSGKKDLEINRNPSYEPGKDAFGRRESLERKTKLRDAAAMCLSVFQSERAAVRFCYLAAEHQTDARAAGLGRKKRNEQISGAW